MNPRLVLGAALFLLVAAARLPGQADPAQILNEEAAAALKLMDGSPAHLQAAESRLKDLEKLAASNGWTRWVFWAQWKEALCESRLGHVDQAAQMLQKVVENAGRGNPSLVRMHYDLVSMLIDGKPASVQKAKKILEEMKQEAARDGLPDWETWADWKHALCDYRLGQANRAKRALREAIRRSWKQNACLPLMHLDLAEWYQESWQFQQAEEQLQEALQGATQPGYFRPEKKAQKLVTRWDLARMKLLKVGCLAQLAESQSAERALQPVNEAIEQELERFREQHEPIPEQWAILAAQATMQLSELDRRASRRVQSIRLLQKCLSDLHAYQSGPSLNLQLNCHFFLAKNYVELGRYREARSEVYDEVKSILPAIENAARLRDLYLARTTIEVEELVATVDDRLEDIGFTKQLDMAQSLALKALGSPEPDVKVTDVFAATVCYALAQIHGIRGRVLKTAGKNADSRREYQHGKALCDQAIPCLESIYRDAPRQEFPLYIRRLRAWLNLELGDVHAAREEARQVLGLFLRTHRADHVDAGEFSSLLVEIDDRAGDSMEAGSYADQNRRVAGAPLERYLTGLTGPEQITFLRKTDDPQLQTCLRLGTRYPAFWDRSARWLINGKARAVEVAGRIYQRERSGQDSKQFLHAVEREAYLLYGRPSGDTRTLQRRFWNEEALKRELSARQTIQSPNTNYTLDDLRRRLGPDEVYVDVYCLRAPDPDSPRAFFAWVVTKTDLVQVVKLGEAHRSSKDGIEDLTTAFVRHQEELARQFSPGGATKASDYVHHGGWPQAERDLHKILKPLSQQVLDKIMALPATKGKNRWIIGPDASLWNVPWSALLLPGTDKYAIEQLTIRYVNSGRDLLRPEVPSGPPGDPWILAAPSFESNPGEVRGKPRTDFWADSLPETYDEAIQVTGALRKFFHSGPSWPVKGAEATKASFFNVKRPRVLYLSTHGFASLPGRFPVDDPLLRCGIALAGFNYVPDDPRELPGLLTGAEVLSVDLGGTDLVVLSSCETGTGGTYFGQSPANLAQAFRLAGARAVISSLWSVEAGYTRQLLVDAMKNYAIPGTAKADALRKAQLDMIHRLRSQEYHSHPFFWAAFTLSGS